MLSNTLSKTTQIGEVLRNHLEADMMHDALRSDVLASIAARNPAYGLSSDDVKADMEQHIEHFSDMVETNSVLTNGTDVDAVVEALRALGATVATGRFRADMDVELINDGPVTLPLRIAPPLSGAGPLKPTQ